MPPAMASAVWAGQLAGRPAFHLRSGACSYLLAVAPGGDLHHLHFGARLEDADAEAKAASWAPGAGGIYVEHHSRDYPSFGNNDLRTPAFLIEHPGGSRLSEFRYREHRTERGGRAPLGLPGARHSAESLWLVLEDAVAGQELELGYSLLGSVLLRRARLKQLKGSSIVRKLASAALDLPPGRYEALSLPGDWSREKNEQRCQLPQGLLRLESRRGVSSHQMSPYLALGLDGLQESGGPAWGLSLIYSGNWLMELEGQPSGSARLTAGLNDFDFAWPLQAGESFETPEAVLAYSPDGLGGLSRALHDFVRQHLLAPQWRKRETPILLNSWEACYFKFAHKDIVDFAKGCKDLGAEMLVLDDGWFGKRDDDTSSLGDWEDDLSKLPQGVAGLAAEIRALGLKFGLWFEPESISRKSRLFERHPDWAVQTTGRPASEARNQLIIDMSRPDVRDYLFERMSHYVRAAKLDYIKWDMNRPLWETPQASLSHRFMLGTYELMRRLQEAFPDLLVEACSGGGGRFDYGVLAYHPQVWASDNTDALERIRIQWNSSLFLPCYCQGAHVSEVPNHLTGRSIPMDFRGRVAMAGNFGFELNPGRMSEAEKAQARAIATEYKGLRHLVRDGDFHRLRHPSTNAPAWIFVSKDRREAALFAFQLRARLRDQALPRLRLQGLDPGLQYHLEGVRRSGASLLEEGLDLPLGPGEWQSCLLRLQAAS